MVQMRNSLDNLESVKQPCGNGGLSHAMNYDPTKTIGITIGGPYRKASSVYLLWNLALCVVGLHV
jgi:hypothetical protein